MALAGPPLKKVANIDIGKNNYRVTLSSNVAAVRKQLLRFTKKGVRTAEFRAINRSLGITNTALKKRLAEDYNLAQKTLAPHLSQKKANFNVLSAYIQGRGEQIPVIKGKGKATQKKDGVAYNAGGGRQVHAGTFLAVVGNHKGVFERHSDWEKKGPFVSKVTGVRQYHGLGIRERHYPPVANMVSQKKRGATMFKIFTKAYERNLLTQLNHQADRAGAALV